MHTYQATSALDDNGATVTVWVAGFQTNNSFRSMKTFEKEEDAVAYVAYLNGGQGGWSTSGGMPSLKSATAVAP